MLVVLYITHIVFNLVYFEPCFIFNFLFCVRFVLSFELELHLIIIDPVVDVIFFFFFEQNTLKRPSILRNTKR